MTIIFRMSLDSGAETNGLPFNMEPYKDRVESAGTKVYLPDSKEGQVIKVSKRDIENNDSEETWRKILEYRDREKIAINTAGPITKKAIVPQSYALVEGTSPNNARIARTQKYIEGVPLKKLGFSRVMNLDSKDTDTLRAILLDSMRCYLKYGVNYDLVGSDERDAVRTRTLYLKRLIFPLRNSSNLLKSEEGIKLVDPNVYGHLSKEKSIKSIAQQALLFMSSAVDYLFLSAHKLAMKS